MSKTIFKSETELRTCPFCGGKVIARKEITRTSDGNTMYEFSIEHTCDAIDRGHLSLFFQNEDSSEKCRATLDADEKFYSAQWNTRVEEK